jgi:cytochrome c oxidase subunit 3
MSLHKPEILTILRTKKLLTKNSIGHGFHLVDPSPWPISAAFAALMLTFGGVMYMHGYWGGGFIRQLGLELLLFVMYVWWRDIIREGTIEGQHTSKVQLGLRLGMLLFIVSEIMFFFCFFLGFFSF